MLTFGPNMKNGSVDESFVDVYLVYPVDDCAIAASPQIRKHTNSAVKLVLTQQIQLCVVQVYQIASA